jgi:hypothetical protein
MNQGEEGVDCGGPCPACPPVLCTLANGTVIVCPSASPTPRASVLHVVKPAASMLPVYAGAGAGGGVVLVVLVVVWRRRVLAKVKRSRVNEAVARLDGDPEDARRQQALTRGPPGSSTART